MTRPSGDTVLSLGNLEATAFRSFPGTTSTTSTASFMSPLTLPRGVSGYFDNFTSSANSNSIDGQGTYRGSKHSQQVYSPLSPGVRGPALTQPRQFLSPHLLPYQISEEQQPNSPRRSVTTSSTHQQKINNPRQAMASPPASYSTSTSAPVSTAATHGMSTSQSCSSPIPSISSVSAGHPRGYTPGETGIAGSAHQAQMIKRLVQQNGRIREAWEAERKYMEANRERVEEVYKEERALMEEERVEWDLEREALLRKIAMLEQQVVGLSGYPEQTKYDVLAGGQTRSQRTGNGANHGVSGWEMSPNSMRSPTTSQGKRKPSQPRNGNDSSLGDAASQSETTTRQSPPPKPDFEFAQHHPRFSPDKQPESSPFFVVTNNSYNSNTNTMQTVSSLREDGAPVPTVDVQEIIPTSEGIPIKASAVQKTTFSDGSGSGSPSAGSTSGSGSGSGRASGSSSGAASQPTSRTPSPPADITKLGTTLKLFKKETVQVLTADPRLRLTMHAGHTPNHSMSVIPTVTTTASSSGTATPTHGQETIVDSTATTSTAEIVEPPSTVAQEESGVDTSLTSYELDPEQGDRPLKGPLMVRNMPAHDEIFFKQLTDKLQEVSHDAESSMPTVLKDVEQTGDETAPKPDDALQAAVADADDAPAPVKSDRDSKSNPQSPGSNDGAEIEVPLKIKKNSNFGAPFGVCR